MKKTPYTEQPDHCFWRRAVAEIQPRHVDPVVRARFTISAADRVATAGSCFAQHIGRYLREHDLGYYVAETIHPLFDGPHAKDYGYGVFSARYGNIYTSRQLLQLFKRAYGEFHPVEDVWRENGRYIDPFRPQIQPDGFASEQELLADRAQHLACVRRMFETLSVFVFTLGLTECWASRDDGAVFPVCPGAAGGTFSADRHVFLNLSVSDVVSDMQEFIGRLKAVNPAAKVILTVSPVPLVATAEDRHVLVATTYSKSVLRVAAEELARAPDVAYFPSYEIITGNFHRGRYYAEDLRSVTEKGVAHVMGLFLRHYALRGEAPAQARRPASQPVHADPASARMAQLVEVDCDEEALDRG